MQLVEYGDTTGMLSGTPSVPFLITAEPLCGSMTSVSWELMPSLNCLQRLLYLCPEQCWHAGVGTGAGFLSTCYFACVHKEFYGSFFQSTQYFEILLLSFRILLHFVVL